MLNRKSLLNRAYEECMVELYERAQPSVNYKELVEGVKNGTIEDSNKNPIYNRYYLSYEEFKYVLNKYIEAYNIKETWTSHIELLEKYLNEGGSKDKWIPERIEENGFKHPGYRGYEEVKPIKKQIENLLKDKEININVLDDIINIVMNTIKNCREFYRFDREESSFSASIALGASPTSYKDTVIEYWKSQGVDLKIEDRNPLLFWERDYYGDEFEEVMLNEYGENWEEYWDDKWKEELEEKEKQRQERLKFLEELNNNERPTILYG